MRSRALPRNSLAGHAGFTCEVDRAPKLDVPPRRAAPLHRQLGGVRRRPAARRAAGVPGCAVTLEDARAARERAAVADDAPAEGRPLARVLHDDDDAGEPAR